MSKKTNILYFSASPKDQTELEVDKEFRAIYEKVDGEYFRMVSVSNTKVSDILTILLRNNPEIVHFSGHATSDELFFEDSRNDSKAVQKNALINSFRNLSKKPQIVFLNSCWSAENLESLSRTINFVVATQREIFDDVAIIFAAKFYEFLSLGETVEAAFNLAKNQFDIEGSENEVEMYELFTREGVNDKTFVSSPNEPDKPVKPSDATLIKIDRVTGEIVNIGQYINQKIYKT